MFKLSLLIPLAILSFLYFILDPSQRIVHADICMQDA